MSLHVLDPPNGVQRRPQLVRVLDLTQQLAEERVRDGCECFGGSKAVEGGHISLYTDYADLMDYTDFPDSDGFCGLDMEMVVKSHVYAGFKEKMVSKGLFSGGKWGVLQATTNSVRTRDFLFFR